MTTKRSWLVIAAALVAGIGFGLFGWRAWLEQRTVYVALFALYTPVPLGFALWPEGKPMPAITGARFLLGWGSFRGALLRATLLGLTALAAIVVIGWRTTQLPLAVAVVFLVLGLRDAAFVTVGESGILVRRLLAKTRFVPYTAIANIELTGKDVRLRLHEGSPVTLHDARFSERPLVFARAVTRRLTPLRDE